MPTVDPPSRPRNAIVFSLRAFASCKARTTFLDLPGSGQANEHIARNTERRHLTRKDFIETIIVPSGGENSAIARETNRRKRTSIFSKTHDKLRRKMGCISRAAAVPAHQQFVACAQTLIDHIGILLPAVVRAETSAKILVAAYSHRVVPGLRHWLQA